MLGCDEGEYSLPSTCLPPQKLARKNGDAADRWSIFSSLENSPINSNLIGSIY